MIFYSTLFIKECVKLMKEKPLKSKKINIKDSNEIPEKVDALNKILFEKPQICFIDIENKIKDNLMERGFNIQSGTLGKGVIVPNTNNYLEKGYKCRANWPNESIAVIRCKVDGNKI